MWMFTNLKRFPPDHKIVTEGATSMRIHLSYWKRTDPPNFHCKVETREILVPSRPNRVAPAGAAREWVAGWVGEWALAYRTKRLDMRGWAPYCRVRSVR